MKKAILFVRVSTDTQDYQRQIDDLNQYAQANEIEVVGTVSEKISGAIKNENRSGINELIKRAKLKEFDTVIITELSRLGRNAFEIQKLIQELYELNINLYIHNLNMQTLDNYGRRSPMVELMLAIIGQFAQMERQFFIERINSGIKKSKASGIHCGRPRGTFKNDKKLLKEYAEVIRDLKAGISIRKTAKIHNISTKTVMKVKTLITNEHTSSKEAFNNP